MINALVIAGSYEQFRYWLYINRLCFDDYKYLAKWQDCHGYHNLPILTVEQWWKSPVNPEEIARIIQDEN